ncbi:DNA-binding transcriptional response regulator, NtrC family, contains REC, AAA-type ATPase, and a Fis-type DNA-binding domains [Peptoclostridium litorale DSM 5388]|uniref:Stage 0 sporulation protein A homolog n=1 Tax=Peptoclostridium litorale DSM 5388 TaxID=1121324 RepID=A0A069RGN4_PEPLI|nr:sigma-54 dependent transcriptional regulator [Peptoclostridium litorale]KDR96156.1 transcriptional regulatory protein ZraR [Peptoclostridium litorale DSM 5388]SIO03376.1 DNA-binding transcriptional response regulator, NtrC family, contains REC, AAA-type ATPase, and a Fis-type DNA-binding domains [Peptoclostridium litorale DSM 5388]
MKKDKKAKILLIDDEIEYTQVLGAILSASGYNVAALNAPKEALGIIEKEHFDIVITDIMMPEVNGMQVLEHVKKHCKSTRVIIMTGYGTIENAVDAIKKGAYTYFVKGNDPGKLLQEIEKISSLDHDNLPENAAGNKKSIKKPEGDAGSSGFLLDTKSKKFAKTLQITEKAARSNVNILILGESGVGKEVFAKFIHESSMRSEGAFVPVNCHSFSESLLESELFGHEKGAFTGAVGNRAGRFEASDGGTLFLDEIGDVSLDTQVKLLRVLESKSIEKIGSNALKKLDFRLVSATNKDLQEEVALGRFREDFFYRISTIVIKIPPLRERKEDLGDYIDFFVKKAEVEQGIKVRGMSVEVEKFLYEYDYPGNIRELKNIIERLVVLSEDGIFVKEGLPVCTNYKKGKKGHEDFEIRPLKEIRKDFEAEYIQKVLDACSGSVTEAAKLMDISRRQLFNKITEFGLR